MFWFYLPWMGRLGEYSRLEEWLYPKVSKITSVSSHKFIFSLFSWSLSFIFHIKTRKRFLTNLCPIRKAGSLSPRFGPFPRLRIFRHWATSFSDFYCIFTSEVQIYTAVNGFEIFLVNISHFSASHMQIQPYHLSQLPTTATLYHLAPQDRRSAEAQFQDWASPPNPLPLRTQGLCDHDGRTSAFADEL